jgi:hypothetical protein
VRVPLQLQTSAALQPYFTDPTLELPLAVMVMSVRPGSDNSAWWMLARDGRLWEVPHSGAAAGAEVKLVLDMRKRWAKVPMSMRVLLK